MKTLLHKKIWIGVFLALVFGIAVLNLLATDRTFSENENRQLASFPEFSLKKLINGEFTADFETYITDQFVARDDWVGIKTITEQLLGKQSSGGVYFAADDYLIEMFDQIDHEQYERNLGYVAAFTDQVQNEFGVEVHTILAPTASCVLADKLPAHAPEIDQGELFAQAAAQISGFVNVSDALCAHADEYIYYRTDHHWTSLGAAYAYNVWREMTGRTASNIDSYEQTILSNAFYGTTYSKASLYTAKPDTITAMLPNDLGAYTVDYNNGTITDSMYTESYLDVKDKYAVFLNANQPLIKITTNNKNGERLLIIKDSYANSFVQMVLADYEEIHIIDPRYYKLSPFDFVQQNGITEVLVLYNVKGFSNDTNLYYLTA